MTRALAIAAAHRRATRTGQDIWIVYESGEWDTASTYDLDTFYNGNHHVEGPFDPKPAPAQFNRWMRQSPS